MPASGPHAILPAPPPHLPGAAPAGLEGIWPQVCGLLAHVQAMRGDEGAVQAQQRGMVRDGCFVMPSPFPGRDGDRCCRSWFHEFQFYYEFDAGRHGTYYWITGLLSRGYSLDHLWFPAHRAAASIDPTGVDSARLERFAAMLAEAPDKPAGPPGGIAPRLAVAGFQHMVHMLWNELPALDRLAAAGLPASAHTGAFGIAVQCEPFGPTRELFPELAPWIRTVRHTDLPALNGANGLVLGLGSWTITPGTQARVRRVAARHAGPAAAARQAAFRDAHGPVFWLSVKPPNRTLAGQEEALAGLIAALRAAHPGAGFILDGASAPWDFPANPNYPPWFHKVSRAAAAGSAAVIAGVLARLDPLARDHVVALNGIPVCQEVGWGAIAGFYVCHGGTMHNKIGWLHPVPGFVHSNHAFLAAMRGMPDPVPGGPPCALASAELVRDDDPAGYGPHELARKDQNYSFTSLDRFVEEVRAAFLATR